MNAFRLEGMAWKLAAAGLAALTWTARPTPAQERVTVLTGATVYPVDGPPLTPGVVVMSRGVIQVVGDRNTGIPEGAEVIDCTGMVITPGLVDAATTVGVEERDTNEQADEVTPQMRILDAVDPTDRSFVRARRSGVTTVQISPGNRNVIGGLGAVVKTWGTRLGDMLLRDDSCLRVTMGSEPSRGNRAVRFGTPDSIYYRRPTTRMGVVWAVRKAFYDAQAYREQKTLGAADDPAIEDPGMEVLLQALDRKLQVRTTARAEQDIRTALRLAEEFGYETVIEEATEAYQVAEMLADARVRVIVGSPSAQNDDDGAQPRLHTLNALAAQGVPFAIASGSRLGAESLAHEAMFAVRNGLTDEQALAAVTLEPARILGVDDRVGSLTAGKDADVVVWSGSPFDPVSTVAKVYVSGQEIQ